MNIKEHVGQFLPKYLSPKDKLNLKELIKDFPYNLDSRFYTSYLKGTQVIYQGDGIKEMKVIQLPNPEIKNTDCIILSNTCDIDVENSRIFASRLTYAPIISLRKYIDLYRSHGISKDRIDSHVISIKEQEITQILYLPKNASHEESIVFLDRINNCANDEIDRSALEKKRLFTLSNYGFYILLLKLSVSFSRIAEKVNRK